ncbi:MAG: hypothetical protein JKY94_01200 [Rhodobacteraceae bacterium]|nr:hypothetical protein [Paracoccaceae bacterium]
MGWYQPIGSAVAQVRITGTTAALSAAAPSMGRSTGLGVLVQPNRACGLRQGDDGDGCVARWQSILDGCREMGCNPPHDIAVPAVPAPLREAVGIS